MDRIAITGGNGVLGTRLCELLDRNKEIYSVYTGNILDLAQLDKWLHEIKPGYVIHLAAKVPIDKTNHDPYGAFDVNVTGTLNLLKTIRKNIPDAWFYMASTCHVYKPSNMPLKETDMIDPLNIYAKTKALAENIAKFYRDNSELKICIGRIFSIYDDLQKKPALYPGIISRLRHHSPQLPFIVKNGNDIRDILPASRIAEITYKIMKSGFEGVINQGSGNGITILDFVKSIASADIEVIAEDHGFSDVYIADTSRLNGIIDESGW